MKKIYTFMMLLLVATMSLSLTSCNSDDDDNDTSVTVSDFVDTGYEYTFYILITRGEDAIKWSNIYAHDYSGIVYSYKQQYQCSSEAVAINQLEAIERTEDIIDIKKNGKIIDVTFDPAKFQGMTITDVKNAYEITKAEIYKYYGK